MATIAKQLSEREIQEEYNISTRTLQGWRTRKKGPPYRKVGGTLVRYDRVEFEAWLQSSPAFLTPLTPPSPVPTARRPRRQTARQSR
jgi:predicted DNA-binding transcriptional regulator AlpA